MSTVNGSTNGTTPKSNSVNGKAKSNTATTTALMIVSPAQQPPKETPPASTPTTDTAPSTGAHPQKAEEKQELKPLQDRFYLLDVLLSHRERYDKLKESLDKLNKFKLSNDGRQDNITLKDAANNTFTTSNPDVFKQVIEWLKADIGGKLADADKAINL